MIISFDKSVISKFKKRCYNHYVLQITEKCNLVIFKFEK